MLMFQVTPGIDLSLYFVSLAAVAAATLGLTEFVKSLVNLTTSWVKQVVAWVIGVGLAFLGYYLQLGIFAGIEVTWVVIYGLAAGLVANGVFDIVLVQAILDLFKAKKPSA